MSQEAALWRNVRENISPFGYIARLENRIEVGWPDCLFHLKFRGFGKTGLLELKRLLRWPPKKGIVRVPVLTLDQVLWHEKWAGAGGVSYLLLQVDRDYLLFPPSMIRGLYVGMTRIQMQPFLVGSGVFPTKELLLCLTQT